MNRSRFILEYIVARVGQRGIPMVLRDGKPVQIKTQAEVRYYLDPIVKEAVFLADALSVYDLDNTKFSDLDDSPAMGEEEHTLFDPIKANK